MTSLGDRPNTALLIVDVQRDVVANAHDRELPSEPLVHKRFGDSFEETDLEALLGERKVGRLVVTGAQTDACIRSTLHGALVRGYDAVLVSDAHTTEDPSQWGAPLNAEQVIAHTNLYWNDSAAPGRSGSAVPAAEVDF